MNLVEEPGLEEVLEQFEQVLDKMPAEDSHPDYTHNDTSFYDVPPEFLERGHQKDLGRSNMSSPIIRK